MHPIELAHALHPAITAHRIEYFDDPKVIVIDHALHRALLPDQAAVADTMGGAQLPMVVDLWGLPVRCSTCDAGRRDPRAGARPGAGRRAGRGGARMTPHPNIRSNTRRSRTQLIRVCPRVRVLRAFLGGLRMAAAGAGPAAGVPIGGGS